VRTLRHRYAATAVLATLLAAGSAAAQAPPPPSPPPPPLPPEVLADGRVTFRLRAPNAREVFLAREGAERAAMQKDAEGVWTVTTAPLPPDYYGYGFVVDGVSQTDPSNHVTKPNFIWRASEVHVPGPGLPWEVAAVPRGTLHRHFHRSAVTKDDRDFFVYTPPGYDPKAKQAYPVLYLLHGYSDDASAWTIIGRAHVILDNLIAEGKANPMLVVMPFGYGAPEILNPSVGFRDPAIRRRNTDRLRDVLFGEIVPAVERTYHVAKDRESRAIAGLSMGGGQSLSIGLGGLDKFAWVGAFSSAIPDDPAATFAGLDPARIRLLWVACGTEDFLIAQNRQFHAFLDERKVKHTWIERPGAHTWMFWRRNLAEIAPLLFR
jgi:enterochelin esterase-like enzyme